MKKLSKKEMKETNGGIAYNKESLDMANRKYEVKKQGEQVNKNNNNPHAIKYGTINEGGMVYTPSGWQNTRPTFRN